MFSCVLLCVFAIVSERHRFRLFESVLCASGCVREDFSTVLSVYVCVGERDRERQRVFLIEKVLTGHVNGLDFF